MYPGWEHGLGPVPVFERSFQAQGHTVAFCKLCVLLSKPLAGSVGGVVFVLDNMLSDLCFVLPDNDGIDQRLVRLFISWQCSKSRSCLNKSDTTVVQSLLQLLMCNE